MADSQLPSIEDVRSAYFYLMGRIYAIQQEHIDIEETPYNTIKYNPLGAESADFVNPNLDVAYLETWIAVDDTHAVIMNVPKIENRYYTVQVLDGWGEVIANVNERNYPEHPAGKIAFVKKGTNPAVPEEALVIELTGSKAKILARVELADTPDEAVSLQHAFTLEVPDSIEIEKAPDIPALESPHLPAAWIFENVEHILASYPDSMPDAPKLARKAVEIEQYCSHGEAEKAQIQKMIDDKVIPYFFDVILESRTAIGGWTITDIGGRFGNNYEMRALINFGGIWANTPEEVIYYSAHKDAEGNPLSGSNTYSVRFEADSLPDDACAAFWSLTMLRMPGYRIAPNVLNRFTINNVSSVQYGEDGSLTLYTAPELPEGVPQGNWLPSPADTVIELTFRVYVPLEKALKKDWFVPPLTRVGK